MPIYEYQCLACHQPHEALQKVTDEALVVCPHCEQPKLVKQISAAGFQLKGTGWYVTDFRDKGKPKEAKSADAASTTKGSTE